MKNNFIRFTLALTVFISFNSEKAISQSANNHREWASLLSTEIKKRDLPFFKDIDSVQGVVALNSIESIKKSDEYITLDAELSNLWKTVKDQIIDNEKLWELDEFRAFEIETYKNLTDMVTSDSLCAKLRYPNIMSVCNSHRLSVLFQLDQEINTKIETACTVFREAQVQFSAYMHTNFGIEMWPLITECNDLYIMIYSLKGEYGGSLIRLDLDESQSKPVSFSIVNNRVQFELDYEELSR